MPLLPPDFFLFLRCQIISTLMLLLLHPLSLQAGVPLHVEVTGLQDPLKQNVLNFLDIVKKKDDANLSVRWIKRLHAEATDEIREAIQPFGYYLPVIDGQLTETDGKWFATYKINPGPPLKIAKRDVQWQGEGADNPVLQESIRKYENESSATLIHSQYESAKSNFLTIALSAGYPEAAMRKSEVLVDLQTNSAVITLIMDTGPRYYFGDIHFKQDFLTSEMLNYYVTIHPGDIYANEALLRFQQNLIASGYAREVTIEPLFAEARERKVPLNVLMKPVPPHRFAFGFGYETDVGIRGSARWTDRLINRYGHHSELYLELSEKERQFEGQYFIPVRNQLTDSCVSRSSYEYEEKPTTTSKTFELETAFVRRNLEDTHFYKGFILRSAEQFVVDDDPEKLTELLILGTTIRFSDMEEDMFPRSGHFAFADLRGGADFLLSDTSFTRLDLRGTYMFGLGENGRINTRMEIGAAWVDDFDAYPPSLRYFAGGDNSVRGYAYESLGPEDEDGVVVGGKQILTGSFEYDHRVAKSWVIAGFVDAGNAYNDEIEKLYTGAGFGFRWLAPFGSLRVDFAWPVTESPELDDVRLHVGFGATL